MPGALKPGGAGASELSGFAAMEKLAAAMKATEPRISGVTELGNFGELGVQFQSQPSLDAVSWAAWAQ